MLNLAVTVHCVLLVWLSPTLPRTREFFTYRVRQICYCVIRVFFVTSERLLPIFGFDFVLLLLSLSQRFFSSRISWMNLRNERMDFTHVVNCTWTMACLFSFTCCDVRDYYIKLNNKTVTSRLHSYVNHSSRKAVVTLSVAFGWTLGLEQQGHTY